ncbi:hypothetical protein EO244_16705 [Ancylomarina salipaludis]|uniref:Uncharacterized protein n=1 Tax=Ancylomarina salipaludis TaxID=2501299 RepID=A0A4Q1JHW3_9BACT|nr:hypothetical protein [Ancylomarina salipaludis]RXQ87120.1 hypothetical protein EO244_16705 [Ancylomarina salipaludis]
MRSSALVLFFVLIGFICLGQTKTFYHEFYETASDIHIKKWNINKANLPSAYVQETVDNQNRVIELKFFKNGTLDYTHLCYVSVWIKYEYPDNNTIIEYYLNSKGQENAEFECEMPSRTTFKLSENQKIILSTESKYKIDKSFYIENDFEESQLNEIIKSLESQANTDRVVSYFCKSYYKMNGIYPVSNEFDINDLMFSDVEKAEIEKSLKK